MKKISILHFSQVSGGGVEKYIKLFLKYSFEIKITPIKVIPVTINHIYKSFGTALIGTAPITK